MNDPTPLTVGGLFSGIGGIELGLERAGMRVLWHCEADAFCQHILSERWPGVPCYPDVRELRASDLDPVDVLCGGFPCQDISLAGAGAGITGSRSGLWVEFARLIGELRPRYVLIENVAALLARGLNVVLGDLAALGFDAEWDCVPASAVGAPHRRDRIWIVAYPSGGAAGRGAGERQAVGGPESRVNGAAQHLADANGAGQQQLQEGAAWGGLVRGGERDDPAARSRRESGWPTGGWWAAEPDVGRVAHGVPARVDRLKSLGNAVVPQIPEWIGRRIIAWEAQQMTSTTGKEAA